MKKILILLLITALAMLSLVACFKGNGDNGGGEGDNPCQSGHSFTTYTSNNDATCTADGTKTATCDNCEATNTVKDEGTMKAHAYTAWVVVKNADCTNEGTEKSLCDGCKEAMERSIPALDHTYNTETYGYQGSDGHAHRCTACGEKDTVTAHTPGDAATETAPQICTVCEYVIAAPIEHTHAFVLETVKEPALKSVATCESAAVYYKSCACGAISASVEEVFTGGEALGHDFAPATCLDPKTCKRNGCAATEGEALGHDLDEEWTVVKDATYMEDGEKRRYCSNCNHYESQTIPKTGNIDPDGWTQVNK